MDTAEDFANFIIPNSKRKAPVLATLLKHPNCSITAEGINKELGLDIDKATIDETQRVLREAKRIIKTRSRKNPRGPPTKEYLPGSLDETYTMPIFYNIFKEARTGYADCCVTTIVAPTTENDAHIHILEERGKNGESKAIDNLILMLDQEEDECTRFNLVMALGRIGGTQPLEALRKTHTNDICEKFRSIASTALKEIVQKGP